MKLNIKELFYKISKKLEIHTIRTKLIISFFVIGLVPLIIFALFSYNTYFGAMTGEIAGYSKEVVKRMERDLDDYMLDIKQFLTGEQDFYINQFIKLNQGKDFANNRKYTFRIWEDFNNIKNMKRGLEDLALTFKNGKIISCYGLYYTDVKKFQPIFSGEISGKEIIFIPPHKNLMNKDVITMARSYYPDVAEDIVVISTDINLDILEGITKVKLGDKGYVFIADQKGNIIYHPEKEMIGKKSKFYNPDNNSSTARYAVENENIILTSTISEVTGWSIVSVAYANELSAELIQIKNITFLIIGIILIGVVILTFYLSYAISYPIKELEDVTKNAVDNDLSVTIEPRGNDEIAQLGNSFNKMIDRIKELMQENIKEQKALRQLELETLDNQMKPHFIYNTLDMIIGHLESDNREEATQLIEALGKFFRLSLSHGQEMVKIGTEIEHVKNYLFIQNFRYENYEYIIDIEDEIIKEKYIPRLILQPLVENAIYHGILQGDKKGLIVIKAYFGEENIYLEINDNGTGMDKDKVKDINAVLKGKKETRDQEQYFGLRNVNKRIKIIFGEQYGLKIESEMGVMTSSIVKIGVLEGEEI